MNRLNAKLMIQARMPVVPLNYLQLIRECLNFKSLLSTKNGQG